MSWQTAVPGGRAQQKRRRASRPAAPSEHVRAETTFTNRHGYTLRRCECGRAILLIHEACIVCDVNATTEKRIADRRAA